MEGGEGGGAKGDLCYSDALSVCALSKSLQTKGLNIWFFIFPRVHFIPSPRCGTNEHGVHGTDSVLMNTHGLQMKVRAVGVRETGVVVRRSLVPF